jgi:hypothetical protein
MGLSFSFLVYSNGGSVGLREMSSAADALAVVRRLYPRTPYEHVDTQRLLTACVQPRGRLAIGVFGDGVLIATEDAHLYDPDILNRRFFKLDEWTDIQLLTSASFNDMFAFGRWRSGVMTRCLSVNVRAGVWRDDGTPEAFEGGQAASAGRWLDLCNAALASTLRLAGDVSPYVANAVDWDDVELYVFARSDRPSQGSV